MNQDVVDYNDYHTRGHVAPADDLVQPVFAPDAQFQAAFPRLAELLALARITPVTRNGALHYLYGWTRNSGGSVGWLSPPPGAPEGSQLHHDHTTMLAHFGGIVKYWGESGNSSWLCNLNWCLTAANSGVGFADGVSGWETGWRDYYFEECAAEGVEPTVDPNEYITFTEEANSNRTLYHRETAAVIMFLYDHAFDFAEPYHETASRWYSLLFYRVKNCPDFRTWVEMLAGQWLDIVRG